MTDKLLGAISLCRKAGRLTMGTDPVEEQARKGKVVLILTARDFAPRSKKQAMMLCERYHLACGELPFTMEELAQVTGKIYGVLAVCDQGFARMIRAQLGETTV